jgi:hypothetical protein
MSSKGLERMKLGAVWRWLVDSSRWAWITLGGGLLIMYLLTLTPGVQGGDAGELQFVPHILSLPHPTGTPLYILLGKIWTLLPLGPSAAWRMTLLAAVSATGAAILVYQITHMIYRHPVPALVAGLSLGLGLTFWEQALLADKYAFNALPGPALGTDALTRDLAPACDDVRPQPDPSPHDGALCTVPRCLRVVARAGGTVA